MSSFVAVERFTSLLSRCGGDEVVLRQNVLLFRETKGSKLLPRCHIMKRISTKGVAL